MLHKLLENVRNDSLLTLSLANLVRTALMKEGGVHFHYILSRSLSVQEQYTVDYAHGGKKYTWEIGLVLGSKIETLCSIIFKLLI